MHPQDFWQRMLSPRVFASKWSENHPA